MRYWHIFSLIFITLILIIPFQSLAASNPPAEWNHQYTIKDSSIFNIIKTKDENYVAVGYINEDISIIKIDQEGNVLWQQIWGTEEKERAFEIIQTNDNGYLVVGDVLTSSYGFNIIVGKFNETGDEEWSQTFGKGGDTRAQSVIQTQSNDFIIVGYSNQNDRGDFDIYIKKISETGEELLTRLIGDTSDDFGYDIIENKKESESYIIAATSNSFSVDNTMDFFLTEINDELTPQWFNTYQGPGEEDLFSIIQTNDTGYALVGTTKPIGIDDWDCFIVKTDNIGSMQWNRSFGGRNEENIRSIVQLSNEDFLIGGYHKDIISYNPLAYQLSKDGLIKQQISIDTFNESIQDPYPDEFAYSMIIDHDQLIFGGRVEGINGVISSIIKTEIIDFNQSFNLYPIAKNTKQIITRSGETINLEGMGYDYDGNISLYQWDVEGDGIFEYESSENGNFSYTFNEPNNYTAYFKITDDYGNSILEKTAINVQSRKPIESNQQNDNLYLIGIFIVFFTSIVLIIIEKKYQIRDHINKSKYSKIFFFFHYSKWTQNLIYSMILLFFLKISIGFLYKAPDLFFDELSYVITAKDISLGQLSIMGNQWFTHGYPVGYSLLLSPAYFLGDNTQLIYQGLLTINILLSVLLMIPAYLIIKNFVSEKIAFFISIIIATLPAVMGHSFMMMTEVTFILFFLFSCYFVMKVYTYEKNDAKFYLLSMFTGILVAFLVLIRIPGIAMFPALLAVFGYYVLRNRTIKSLRYGVTLLPFLPAVIYVLSSGSSKEVGYDVTSYTTRLFSNFINIDSFIHFLNLMVNEFLYYALMSYLLFTIFTILLVINWQKLSKIFDKKIDHLKSLLIYGLISIFMLMIITIVHIQGNYNLYTRYVLPGLPLFFIFGIIGIHYFIKEPTKKNIKLLMVISLIISVLLIFLFPLDGFKIVNNIDLAWFLQRTGVKSAIRNEIFTFVQFIILLIFLPLTTYILYGLFKKSKIINNHDFSKKLKKSFLKRYQSLFIIILLISLLISIPVSQYTYNLDNSINKSIVEPGQWMNENDPYSKIAIDNIYSASSGGGINEGIDWKRFIVSTHFWHGRGIIEPINKTGILNLINNSEGNEYDYVASTHDLTDYFQKIKTFKFNWEVKPDRRQQYIDFSIYKI